MGDRISFNDAIILSGDGLQVVTGKSLLIEDGKVIAIGDPDPSAYQVSLSERLICPMFVNTHIHIGDTGAKELGVGMPLEKVVVPPDGLKHKFLQSVSGTDTHIRMMRDGMLELLHNGIIAMADFREQGLMGVRALRKAAEGLPLRVVALGRMTEGSSDIDTEQEAFQILQESDGLGIRDVESYPGKVLEKLRNSFPDKIFAAHAAENYQADLYSREKTGEGQVTRILRWHPDFVVHLVHASEEELRTLASARIFAVSCPRCNGILGSGQPKLAAWSQIGLQFALGTDNVLCNSPDMMREMDFASRLTRGLEQDPAVLEPRELLQAATIQGARALKLDNELGSLSPGKDASFIVFDLSSPNLKYQQNVISVIVHRATPADIAEIFVKGEKLIFSDYIDQPN
jgi:cytosine/adenosine deaminase-related metal-dependent hydrolase